MTLTISVGQVILELLFKIFMLHVLLNNLAYSFIRQFAQDAFYFSKKC